VVQLIVFRVLRSLVVSLVAISAALLLLVFVLQRKLLYFPTRYAESDALAAAERLRLSPWRDAQGLIVGWRTATSASPVARLLVMHGNAGSALDRVHYTRAFARHGVDVVLLEYPGFGARPGKPTQESLCAAAADAIDQLTREGATPVWLLGESLGSGVTACAIALRPGAVKGLVLLTPFARMTDLVRLHYPFLPTFLLRDRYAPEDDLASWTGPTVLLLAGRDEVVGIAQGRQLAEVLRGPKRVVTQEQATHNGLDLEATAPFWEETVGFLRAGGGK
jgi:pimeloyl-ACP methyl ester carboxylesterase